MDLSLVILSALCFTSVVMAGALAIAWGSFGSPRHAASWAAAFAVSAVQSFCNLVALAAGLTALLALAFVLLLLPGPLIAIGVRQRAGRPSRWRWFAAGVLAAALVLLAATTSPTLDGAGFAVAPLFSAACMLSAARMLRPAGRAMLPAERAFSLALGFMALVEIAAAVPTALGPLWSQDLPAMRVYRSLLVLTVPPAIVCAGTAAMLLVASDLAVDLRRLAARDPLTGLLNRRGFQEAAVRSLANARRFHVPATMVLADIDHFKTVNDRFGHTAGDRVLCYLGERLSAGVRQGDVVARIGGEEFAVLLVADGIRDAHVAIERIRRAIEQGYDYDGTAVAVTTSFGIAAVPLGPGDIDAIIARALDRADRALYLSKIQGRNRVTVDGAPAPAPAA